jgi:predicted nuclease with TOPRIM domain
MLMALLALYLFGSSGTFALVADLEHAKSALKAQVAEGPRKAEMLAIVERAEHTTKEALEKRKKTTQELLGLVHTFDAESGDIQHVLKQLRSETAAYQEQLVRHRFELKAKMSREEWSKVFSR